MRFYQMNEEQLVSCFNNAIDIKENNEEKSEFLGDFWRDVLRTIGVCKERFSFVFILLSACHCIGAIFSILNKDWRLLFIGIALFFASCLFSFAECAVLHYKRNQYEKRIFSDESKVKIIKDGKIITIDIASLQCGDRLYLSKGDIVPADLRVVRAESLYVNEEELFGRTIPSLKSGQELASENLYPEEQSNMLWKGSYVSDGLGEAIVVALGEDCFIEKIGHKKKKAQKSAIYNQKNNIGKITTLIYCTMVAILLLISGGLTGEWLEALLIFSSFISFFVVDPSSFITEWTYLNTADTLYKKGTLVRNIQAFDGINKERKLYVLPSDLIEDTAEYDEVVNIIGTNETNHALLEGCEAYFGRAKMFFKQVEGETIAVAYGYWKEMLPYIKEIDESLLKYIVEYEKHGYMVGAIGVKEIYFAQNRDQLSDFSGELSLRCLVLKKICLDKDRLEELFRLKKGGMDVFLAHEFSNDVSEYVSGCCDIPMIEEDGLNSDVYSLPSKSECAVFSDATQIQKKNAKIIFAKQHSPLQTIYEIKCMICGIERSLNFLYIFMVGLMAGLFVCALKNAGPIIVFPVLLVLFILLLLCRRIVESVKNCSQSRLSLILGGLFAMVALISALVLGGGAIAAWGLSFAIYAALLYLRKKHKTDWDKKELLTLASMFVLSILACLFAEFNVIVALLFAIFPVAASILIDIIY